MIHVWPQRTSATGERAVEGRPLGTRPCPGLACLALIPLAVTDLAALSLTTVSLTTVSLTTRCPPIPCPRPSPCSSPSSVPLSPVATAVRTRRCWWSGSLWVSASVPRGRPWRPRGGPGPGTIEETGLGGPP